MYGLSCVSVNKVKLGVGAKPFFYFLKLKLYGEIITTNSLVVRALVYGTRDDGSNPSW